MMLLTLLTLLTLTLGPTIMPQRDFSIGVLQRS
jgi:hypothetical protein